MSVARESSRLDRVLYPDGAPERPAPAEVGNDRLDMAYAIGVLMANRDLVRRQEAGEEVSWT